MRHHRIVLAACIAAAGCSGTPADAPALDIADVGFATPESVLMDPVADVYLVSNVNGAPLDHDGNGFISRVRADGSVETLKWIDGADAGVSLNAPKGMALLGDTLFVADIDTVRLFDRNSGTPMASRAVPGATFLNDVVASPTGAVYVTDTGVDATFAPNGTDAIWRFVGDQLSPVAQGSALGGPNGIALTPEGLVVVCFGAGGIYRVVPGSAEITELPHPEQGAYDGVIAFADGSMLVSSWDAQAVFRIGADGTITTAVDSVSSPADIGWDAGRGRVMIPIFTENRVVVRKVE